MASRRLLAIIGLCSASIFLSTAPTRASITTYILSVFDPAAGFTLGSPGSITVDDAGGKLLITETLVSNGNYSFRDASDANHWTLAFSLDKTGTTISGLTTGFESGGSVNQSPFGTFAISVDCELSGCVPGFTSTLPKTFSFTVSDSGNDLTANDITSRSTTLSTHDIFFAGDVADKNGLTGNFGAVLGPPTVTSDVPELSTWAMMLLGFLGLGFIASRRHSGVALRLA